LFQQFAITLTIVGVCYAAQLGNNYIPPGNAYIPPHKGKNLEAIEIKETKNV
jgi:hypothetical protein